MEHSGGKAEEDGPTMADASPTGPVALIGTGTVPAGSGMDGTWAQDLAANATHQPPAHIGHIYEDGDDDQSQSQTHAMDIREDVVDIDDHDTYEQSTVNMDAAYNIRVYVATPGETYVCDFDVPLGATFAEVAAQAESLLDTGIAQITLRHSSLWDPIDRRDVVAQYAYALRQDPFLTIASKAKPGGRSNATEVTAQIDADHALAKSLAAGAPQELSNPGAGLGPRRWTGTWANARAIDIVGTTTNARVKAINYVGGADAKKTEARNRHALQRDAEHYVREREMASMASTASMTTKTSTTAASGQDTGFASLWNAAQAELDQRPLARKRVRPRTQAEKGPMSGPKWEATMDLIKGRVRLSNPKFGASDRLGLLLESDVLGAPVNYRFIMDVNASRATIAMLYVRVAYVIGKDQFTQFILQSSLIGVLAGEYCADFWDADIHGDLRITLPPSQTKVE